MITQVKIANVLGIENFGLIAYGMALATYGAMFVRFGLDKTLVRDLIHFPDRYTAIVKASLALRFTLLTLVITAILVWKLFASPTSDLSWG
jgi:O-antigen/teichoic acid export membrane protein